MSPYIKCPELANPQRWKGSYGCQGLGNGGVGGTVGGCKVSLRDNEHVLESSSGNGCTDFFNILKVTDSYALAG